MEPIVGVVSLNSVEYEYWDEICPTCEEIEAELMEEMRGEDLEDIFEEASQIECSDHEKLIGNWKKFMGKYVPDESGEYAAIVTDSTFNCIQVIWSKNTRKVKSMCSPCFPGQADLDSGDGNILAYDLPEDMYYKE